MPATCKMSTMATPAGPNIPLAIKEGQNGIWTLKPYTAMPQVSSPKMLLTTTCLMSKNSKIAKINKPIPTANHN